MPDSSEHLLKVWHFITVTSLNPHNTPVGKHQSPHFIDEGTELGAEGVYHQLVEMAQIQNGVQVLSSSRIVLLPVRLETQMAFAHTSPENLATSGRGRCRPAFAVNSALLNRAVDRGMALCPGEQRGAGPQLAPGTGCLQNHRCERNPEEEGQPPERGHASRRHFLFQGPG